MSKCLHVLHAMNANCNIDKFGLLHYTYDGCRIMPESTTLVIEKTKVWAAWKAKRVKFLGGNANVLASSHENIASIPKHTRHIATAAQTIVSSTTHWT